VLVAAPAPVAPKAAALKPATEKKQRALSPYNLFMRTHVGRVCLGHLREWGRP